jgi:SEC-C motif-containing protein
VETTHPDVRTPRLREEIAATADAARWKFLTIVGTSKGREEDKTGKVEFVAQFYHGGVLHEHHEHSRFRRSRGLWKYVDAKG